MNGCMVNVGSELKEWSSVYPIRDSASDELAEFSKVSNSHSITVE